MPAPKEKLSKKEILAAKKAKKAQLLAEAEERRKKQEELEELRARVKRLLSHHSPPTPCQFVSSCIATVRSNPWILIHDVQYSTKFLQNLVEVFKQHAHIPFKKLSARMKEMKREVKEPESELKMMDSKTAAPVSDNKYEESTDKKTGTADDTEQTEEEEKVPTEAEKRAHLVAQLFAIHDGVRDLSAFALQQPAYFISERSLLTYVVELLQLSIAQEDLFSNILAILSPTVKNKTLWPVLVDSQLSDVIMKFIQHHMPECADDADGDQADGGDPNSDDNADYKGNSEADTKLAESDSKSCSEQTSDGDNRTGASGGFDDVIDGIDDNDLQAPAARSDGAPVSAMSHSSSHHPIILRHQYSWSTFEIVMNTVHALSASPALRSLFKNDAANYLHLRGLASGAVKGFTKRQQTHALKCLQYFIDDSVEEKNMAGQVDPRLANKAMLSYWKGHVHQLFCHSSGTEHNSGVNGVSGMNNGFPRSRRFKPGFGDVSTLEAMNRDVKKRAQAAAASKR